MAETDDENLAYVRRVLAVTGKDPTRLAREAGLSQTTITRPLQGTAGYRITERTVRLIEEATKIPFQDHDSRSQASSDQGALDREALFQAAQAALAVECGMRLGLSKEDIEQLADLIANAYSYYKGAGNKSEEELA